MANAIDINLSDAAMDELQRCENREERGRKLLEFIDQKIDKLQKWSEKNLGGPMARFEVAAVRTFLYREITGELDGDGDIMHLPKVQLAHPPTAEV
jgi:hypothetical protein